MTIMINIGTAFAVFILSVVILSTNYKTIWPAPNFVTHSASFDFVFQDIASTGDHPIDIEYTYKSLPIPTLSAKLINNSKDSTHHEELLLHQSILEKQSNLHHLLHIPPWALVPDRISSTTGSVSDLFTTFDTLSHKQQHILAVLSEIVDIIPTESMMKSHMERLSAAQKYWMKNITKDLFNASQTILSYQLINFADEIQEWVQNSPYSNDYLRLIFERTRGWPLLYNPSIKQQTDDLDTNYHDLCAMIHEMDNEEDVMNMEQCNVFLDSILPWIPDKAATLSTMWPTYYDVDVEALTKIDGINSPYTLVIKQNKKPSGEVLHYVSRKGNERIQVEWFNEEYHLRATNLAFVRRIRLQIKRISQMLKQSVTLSGEMEEEDDLLAFWASLEDDEETRPSDRHIEQLPVPFKEYIKNYATELEKGQFEKILNMDLAQNDAQENKDIFIHGLPSIAVFNDGGIKRAWNFIIGVIDHDLVPEASISNTFIDTMDVETLQSSFHQTLSADVIELEIMGVWPYAVGGYLRAITPEVAMYQYPPYRDAKKEYGKQRCVLLLDVLDKLYSNNMRQIGMQRLMDNEGGSKLITLKSTVTYISNALNIEHTYFHNKDNENNQHSLKQGLFIRLAAVIACVNEANDDDTYGCVLSGVMYSIIEAFNRDNVYSLVFVAFLQNEGLLKWDKKGNKDVMDIMNSGQDIDKLNDKSLWQQWKEKYFNNADDGDAVIHALKQGFVDNNDEIKLYKRAIRHISKYSVLRRPGEDTFVLP